MHPEIQNSVFAVAEEPFCVWGWDLKERNARFIEAIDETYFEYIAQTHLEHLDGEHAQRAAIALRANYHLCLETLFGLIGATLQAPDCVPGWILKASTSQIRKIVELLAKDRMDLPSKWKSETQLMGFKDLARLVFQYASWAQDEGDKTAEKFGSLWYRLAADFLDANSTKEYNSIKHGFRARAGGFTMRVGKEKAPGIPAADSDMKDLGGSRFGTSFYAVEALQDSRKTRSDPHFTLRHHSLNWLPDATAGRMVLASISIKNLKSVLAIANGKLSAEVSFHRPEDTGTFDSPWATSPGVTSASMDLIVSEKQIHRVSRAKLTDIVQKRR